MDEYAFDVRIAVHAASPEEATELMREAVMGRIDGQLLAAQRQARVVSLWRVNEDD